MNTLWQDLRFAWRVLTKSPGFTIVAVLTLALGIGANTAISTVVYGVLLRPLPFPDPDRILQLKESYKNQSDEMDLSSAELKRLRDYSQPFEHIAGYTAVGFNLSTGTQAEHVNGLHVSSEYFSVLGVHPILGRDFTEEEDRGEGQRVALISYTLWQRDFGSDPAKLGQKILLNGDPFTLIGVLPAGFNGNAFSFNNGPAPDVWTPLALVAKSIGNGENIAVLARLKKETTPAQLAAQLDIVTRDFRKQFPGVVGNELVLSFAPFREMIGADVRPYLVVLLGAIGFVLLIACANVANLLLARGSSRGREMAVRIALGGSRPRIFRQLLTESILIAMLGGAFGLLLSKLGLNSLLAIAPASLPRVQDIRLDGAVFGFTFLISILTGALFGLAPAYYATKTNLNEALKDSGGRASAGTGRARLRQGLVIGEFALSLVLLTGAGLMIATFAKLMNVNPGFDPHHVVTMQFWLNGSKYNSTPEISSFYASVQQRIQTLPGVEAVGIVAAGLPLERGGNNGVKIPDAKDDGFISMDYREITPQYFRAVGMPLKQGREFTDADSANSNHVVVINETVARKYFRDSNPLGRTIYVNDAPCEVVGIVGDVKTYLDQPARPATFIPAAQASYRTSKVFEGWFPRTFVVRTSSNPLSLGQSVREAVTAVDALVPTGQIRSMDQVLSHSLALRSFMMLLLSIFGGLALILASVGLYGVISFAVSQRTQEIGVRMALGARPADVIRLVLTEALKLVFTGVALGICAALLLTRLMENMVYGVQPRNPLIFVLVNVALLAVALTACYIPARRAMRVDPIVALRYE
jgi:putative ABC transport system permease protein